MRAAAPSAVQDEMRGPRLKADGATAGLGAEACSRAPWPHHSPTSMYASASLRSKVLAGHRPYGRAPWREIRSTVRICARRVPVERNVTRRGDPLHAGNAWCGREGTCVRPERHPGGVFHGRIFLQALRVPPLLLPPMSPVHRRTAVCFAKPSGHQGVHFRSSCSRSLTPGRTFRPGEGHRGAREHRRSRSRCGSLESSGATTPCRRTASAGTCASCFPPQGRFRRQRMLRTRRAGSEWQSCRT